MKVVISPALIAFAKEFSTPKTPSRRSQGFQEQVGQVRGAGDVMDTIGSLLLWKYLVERGVPSTYLLTALQGDEADVLAQGPTGSVNINVKTSNWDPGDDVEKRCHLAVKRVEFDKLPQLFVQIMVHGRTAVGEPPHVHLCGWIDTASPDFRAQKETVIPNTGGEPGLWINNRYFQPIDTLAAYILGEANV